jgi:hypothetical protein
VRFHLFDDFIVIGRRSDQLGEHLNRHLHFLQEALVGASRIQVFADAALLPGASLIANTCQPGNPSHQHAPSPGLKIKQIIFVHQKPPT